jgi:hypothetical protein
MAQVLETTAEALTNDPTLQPWSDTFHLGETMVNQMSTECLSQLVFTLVIQPIQPTLSRSNLIPRGFDVALKPGEWAFELLQVLSAASDPVVVLGPVAQAELGD